MITRVRLVHVKSRNTRQLRWYEGDRQRSQNLGRITNCFCRATHGRRAVHASRAGCYRRVSVDSQNDVSFLKVAKTTVVTGHPIGSFSISPGLP